MTADPTLATLRERHYRVGQGNELPDGCVTCRNNLGTRQPWPCDAERFRQALDAALEDAEAAREQASMQADVTILMQKDLDAALGERDALVWIVLNNGARLPGFDHYRERASAKPSDPSDERWDCSCGYAGSPEKVRQHWAAMLSERARVATEGSET